MAGMSSPSLNRSTAERGIGCGGGTDSSHRLGFGGDHLTVLLEVMTLQTDGRFEVGGLTGGLVATCGEARRAITLELRVEDNTEASLILVASVMFIPEDLQADAGVARLIKMQQFSKDGAHGSGGSWGEMEWD